MDEKRYSQKGLGSDVEFGKGGPRVKDSSGVIEHRNNADAAYAIVRGGTPVGDDDLTTKSWVEEYAPSVESDADYYVDGTSGSDSNDGSDWANAKKTLDFLYSGGTDALARVINATINVYLRGVIRGVSATRHTVLDWLKGTGSLNFIGTMTSLETFTITGYDDDPTNIDGRMYLDASGASWTVDEHEGHFQKTAASSTYRPIASNTATQLRMNNAPISPGTTSDIYSATVFSPQQESAPGVDIAYTSGNFFAIKDCSLEINVSGLDFRSTTVTVQPAVEDSIHVNFTSCAMRKFVAIRALDTSLYYGYMKFVDWNDWVSTSNSTLVLNSCTIDGNSQGYGVYAGARSFISLFNAYFLNNVEGLSGDGTNFSYIGSSTYFEGNTYGILQNGEPISIDAWSTGGTPTRFKDNTTAWQFGGPVLGSSVEDIVHSGNTTEIRLSPNTTQTFANLNAQKKIANAGAGSNIIYQSGLTYLLTVPEEFDPSISAGLSSYTFQGAIDELAAAAVTKSTFNANTILKADTDDTPAALAVAEQTLVGRITAGTIAALTTTQVRTLLNVEDGAEVNNISDVNVTDLTDAGDSTLHYHAADRARADHTGTQAPATIMVTADQRIVGNVSGASTAAAEITATEVRTMINVADGSDVGDVEAAAAITDDVLVRGDGGAKGVQGTGITVDNSDNVDNVKSIGFTSEYDNGNSGSSFTLTLANGQHQKVNLTSATVTMTISITGASEGTYHLKIARGTASNEITAITYANDWYAEGGDIPTQSTATASFDTWAITLRGTDIEIALAQYNMQEG